MGMRLEERSVLAGYGDSGDDDAVTAAAGTFIAHGVEFEQYVAG